MIDLSKQKLLIVAPHPDDEVLGCGGLIKKIKDAGGKVYVLFLTVGVTMDYSERGVSTGDERKQEVEAVAKFLGYDDYKIAFEGDDYHLKLDGMLQKNIMEELENGKRVSLNTLHPTIVATPFLSDYNQDHSVASRAVFAAARPAPESLKPMQKIILGYESVPTAGWWSSSPNSANFLIPLDDTTLDAKLKALDLYRSQVRPFPHPRSIESVKNLAQYRGLLAGQKAAEAFYSYRVIV
jgi:N-acetylglucosamine malate deacetylase 1